MKRNLLLLCLPALAIIFTPSCKKEDLTDKPQAKTEAQSITVELIKNETWHYALPQNLSNNPYKVTKQAEHFIVSEISMDKYYNYTPAYNYIGNDRVVISNVKENNNSCNGNGNGSHPNDDDNGCGNNYDNKIKQTITINFVIKEKEQGKSYKTFICPVF